MRDDNDPRPRAGMTDVLERHALEWGDRCCVCTYPSRRCLPGDALACCVACRSVTRTIADGRVFVLEEITVTVRLSDE